ncbi:MAG: acetylxylan esterase, partial [Sediminibacterium sp.]
MIYKENLVEPATLVFEATTEKDTTSIGLIVNAEKFKPVTQRPRDIDNFWKQEKAALHKLPISVKAFPVKNVPLGYTCFDIEINCTGTKPARGYFAKPDSAKVRSLPIVIYFHAAGVNPSWSRSEPGNALRYAKTGNGALSFDLNAHGMLNGQSNAYYD